MGISINLRKDKNNSYFRKNLFKLIDLQNVNRFLLCSGYINEIIVNNQNRLTKYSVLDDGLMIRIEKASNGRKIEIATVAGMFRGSNDDWFKSYNEFIKKLDLKSQQLGNNQLNINPKISLKKNWHAKVAIASFNNDPIAGIIGSSNLTGPAYGEKRPRFNHECDVVIWKDEQKLDDIFLTGSSEEDNEFNFGNSEEVDWSPIQTVLRPGFKQGNEHVRLKSLFNEILADDFLEDFRAYRDRIKIEY